MNVIKLIRSDVTEMRANHRRLAHVVLPNLLASSLYRVAADLHRHGKSGRYAARLVHFANIALTGAEIDPRAEIGPGLRIVHTVGVIVGHGTRAGRGLALFGGAVLGARPDRPESGFPILGDNVTVYAKASVIGGVHIGDRAQIAAHSLALIDVPADGVAVGVPAKIR